MATDLYVHGGVYADVDVAPVVGLQAFVQPNDSFVTPGSQSTSWLNPVLIVARPREPLLKVAMHKMLHRYRTTDCEPLRATRIPLSCTTLSEHHCLCGFVGRSLPFLVQL
jgi:hypothetical protein